MDVVEDHGHDPAELLRHAGGRACLALANSVLWRRSARPEELLVDYGALLRRGVRLGILPASDPAALAALAAARPGAAAEALERALQVRERLFVLLSAVAAGEPAPAEELEAFNAAAGEALAHARVRERGGRLERGWSSEPSLLEPLWEAVRDAHVLLLEPADRARLKQCPGPECGWLFLDESRNGSRRWCDPRLCGNRMRVRSHYARKQAARRGADTA